MTDDLTVLEEAALLSGDTVWQTRAVPRAGIRSLWLADGPHGIRKQTGPADHLGLAESLPATCFPTAATVANSWDPQLAESVGEALGAEAAAQGVDVLLGPGLNIKRSPLCGRSFEYFSEDPLLAGQLAAGYVRGIQSQGVAACPKHFAANSQELRRMASDSVVDERTLRELYLTGFELVVREAKPWSLMSSYNKVNGTYAHENHWLLQGVLRDEWGFDGAVVSDWGGGNDPVVAVRAGGTLEMPSPGFDSVDRIVRAVTAGELEGAELDARVRELRMLVERVERRAGAPVADLDSHHRLVRTATSRGAVLLENLDGLLPLAAGTRVAVVGDFAQHPRYQGAGSSVVNANRLVSTLDALPASGLELAAFAPGYTRGGPADPVLVAQAVEVARRAEVTLLYLGLDEVSETEGRDRAHLRLPQAQVDLLMSLTEVSDRIVVVLGAGGVVEMPWLDQCQALLHGYLGGQAGAEAMLDLLTGAVNPSGRLAETYPLRLEDTPVHRYFPAEGPTAEYREGPFVGYRYYTTASVPVRFPFGFGLSYTTFTYAGLEVTSDEVSFTLTNTGPVAGAEVTQLYVGRVGDEGVLRPARELKGFARIELEPGEQRRVAIALDDRTFRHYSTVTGRWEVETGTYELSVGADVLDLRLRTTQEVTGTVTASEAAELPMRYRRADVRDVPDSDFAALLGRPVPHVPAGRRPLRADDPLASLARAQSPLGRLVHTVLARLIARSDAKGAPDLNLLFLYGMPFRAMAKMTNGAISTAMVDAILTVVNGHLFGGAGQLLRAAAANLRTGRRLRRELLAATAGRDTGTLPPEPAHRPATGR